MLKITQNVLTQSLIFSVNTCITAKNILIAGDFNTAVDSRHLDNFIQPSDLTTLVNSPKCHRWNNTTFINIFLKNHKALFKCSKTFSTKIFGYHKLISTWMKLRSFKSSPRKKMYMFPKLFFQKLLIWKTKWKS